MSQMMVAVFLLLWFLYCQHVLHSSQSMLIRVNAALFVALNGMCVLCKLIAYFSYVHPTAHGLHVAQFRFSM